MRVLLVHDAFLKYAVGQVTGLMDSGVEVMTLCRAHPFQLDSEADEEASLIAALRRTGTRVIELPGLLRDVANSKAIIQARRAVAKWNPDVIHVHDQPEPRSVVVAPRRPTVITIHDPIPHPGHPKTDAPWTQAAFDWAERAWRRRADLVIVHSEALKQELAAVRSYPRVRVIPHGIQVASAPTPVPDTATVGFFGKLQPYKGIDVLDAAMPLVWAARPDVQFVVAGRGDVVPQIRDRRLTFHNRYISWQEVEDLLDRASLLALPYTSASQTGVGSLGVGRGIPLVVSDAGGLPELALSPDYVVPAGDPVGLSAAIVRHLDDGEDVRRQVLETIARPRSWPAVGALTAAVYRELLAELN